MKPLKKQPKKAERGVNLALLTDGLKAAEIRDYY